MIYDEKIVLAGGGGHALSLLEAIPDPDSVVGYTAPEPSPQMPIHHLGNDDAVESLSQQGLKFVMAFVYAGLPVMNRRRELIRFYENRGADFATVIAPTAIVTRNSKIGHGAAIMCGAIINRAVIGPHAVVNTGAIVEHDCIIGCNSFIGPGAVLGGAVTIGEDCFIGLGARIKNGVSIASGITVAMGANVTKNLTEPGIYHGHPLRCFPSSRIRQ